MVLASHAFQEVEYISPECPDVASLGFSEDDLDLTQRATVAALDAWDVEHDRHELSPDGRSVKPSRFSSFEDDVLAFTYRTTTAVPGLLDGNFNSSRHAFHASIPVASDVVDMVQ